MTKIIRWDTDEIITEGDGSVRDLVEACAKLGNPSLRYANLVRASLDGANLDGANLDGANLVRASLVRASLVGASLVGASLVGANLVRANLVRANLDGANLDGANLYGANLYGANLDGANLDGASIVGAKIPIWCKWAVTYSMDGTVNIGCKSKSIAEWDEWFAGSDTFDTSRDSEDFKRIRAHYLAVRAYLAEMGIPEVQQ